MNYKSDDISVFVGYTESNQRWGFVFSKTFSGYKVPGVSGSQTGFSTKKEAIDNVMAWVENEGLSEYRTRKIREILEHA